MSHFHPPYLYMNFYFTAVVDEGFVSVFKALIALGAVYSGKITVIREENIKARPFNGRHSNAETLDVAARDIDEIAIDDTIRIVHTEFNKAIGLVKRGEILRYGMISEEASRSDHPPVQIMTSGAIFDPIPELEKQARFAGKRVYRRFIKLVDRVRPAYAAITSEYDMECPTDLKRDPRTIAFSEFYIDADYIGHENIKRIKAAYHKGYIEDVANGIYVSSFMANPKGKIPDKNWRPRDEKAVVANLIAGKTI